VAGRASAKTLSSAAEPTVVALAQSGEADAFEEIVRRKHNRVRRFMRYLSGHVHDGDDLAQQVFLKAWRSISQLKSAVKFDAWLKTIMVTTWLEQARRREIAIATEIDPADLAMQRDATNEFMDLEAALAQLPSAMRLCVVLAYHEGMTHGEIAKLTDIPLGSVKSNIARGSMQLRETLRAYGAMTENDRHGT
jgi:RNA polymerase sigma-70 factor (ECF subfamily)